MQTILFLEVRFFSFLISSRKPTSNFTMGEISVPEWHVNGCMLVPRVLGQEFNYSQIGDTWQQRDERDKMRGVFFHINIPESDLNPDLIKARLAE